ncbi:MAG: radical SAM protein [Akkermansia sp.]
MTRNVDLNVLADEKSTLLVDLVITHACNLNCRYCYETHKSPRRMEAETAKKILRELFARVAGEAQYSRLEISFFGGEPLLHFDLIREISEWLWSQAWPLDYGICITTNGTLLDSRIRSWLLENKHRIDVSLSLDGLGVVQRLNRTTLPVDADFFARNWPHRGITMVLFKHTIHLFADTAREMIAAGFNINVAIGGGFRWSKEQAIVYEEQLQQLMPLFTHDIRAARRSGIFINPEHFYEPVADDIPLCAEHNTKKCSFDTDGRPYRCHMLMPLVVGAQCSEDLRHLFSERCTMKVDSRCRACPLLSECRICPAMNMKLTGSVDTNASCDTNCIMLKVQARQSALLHLQFYAELTRQGLVFSDTERMTIEKSLRLLDDIPPAADL